MHSKLHGFVIGILVFIVFIASFADWMFGLTFIPINTFVSFLTFVALVSISGILLVFSFKALSLGVV